MRGFFFRWEERPRFIFQVLENKLLTRRFKTLEDEASSRSLIVAFFNIIEEQGPELIVNRIDPRGSVSMTVPELLENVGFELPRDARNQSERNIEDLYHNLFAELNLQRFSGTLEVEAPQMHTFSLLLEGSAEKAFFEDMPRENLTRMALARRLELATSDDRRQIFKQSIANIERLLQHAGLLDADLPEVRRRGRRPHQAEALEEPRGQGEGTVKGKAKGIGKGQAKGIGKGKAQRRGRGRGR
jgi:hypothetical protein